MGISASNSLTFTNNITGVQLGGANIANARKIYYARTADNGYSGVGLTTFDCLMEEAAEKTKEDLKTDKLTKKEDKNGDNDNK
jgi:hypothetical protein